MDQVVAVTMDGANVSNVAPAAGLAELYVLHRRDAIRLAFLLCGDEEEAQDVVQDAFVRLLSRPRVLRDATAFPAYLRRTVATTCFSRRRSAVRERSRLERTAKRVEVEPEPVRDDQIWSALGRLSPRQRAAVVMRYWMDLSEAEIASTLRCRPGTVKSLVARALATMREEVPDVGD